MPRRGKMLGLVIVVALCIFLYLSSSARSTRTSEFYTRTVAAIDARQQRTANDAADLEAARVRTHDEKAAQAARDRIAGDSPPLGAGQKPLAEAAGDAAAAAKDAVKDAVHGVVESGEKSVAGRKMMAKDGKAGGDDGVAKVGNTGAKPTSNGEAEEKTDEDHEVDAELNAILKKSPIIIFSKSYCPYSKKAKHILLDLYKIVPAPYVVELDEHAIGPQLQAALGKSTNRRTVPNILISGKSIGGGDDVAALDEEDTLVEKIKSMGGKRIMEVTRLERKTDS